VKYTDYTAFKPAIAQLRTNNYLSLQNVPHTSKRTPTKLYNNGRSCYRRA